MDPHHTLDPLQPKTPDFDHPKTPIFTTKRSIKWHLGLHTYTRPPHLPDPRLMDPTHTRPPPTKTPDFDHPKTPIFTTKRSIEWHLGLHTYTRPPHLPDPRLVDPHHTLDPLQPKTPDFDHPKTPIFTTIDLSSGIWDFTPIPDPPTFQTPALWTPITP